MYVNLGLFYGPMIASLGFLSVLFYTGFKLTPAKHAHMLIELKARRVNDRAGR